MNFKFSIGNHIEVPVHLKLRDGQTVREFKFHVTGKRLSAQEAREKLDADSEATVGEFLSENLIGWRGQTLVIDEATGAPVDFSAEALAALLNVAGVAGVIYLSYLKELAASDGTEARRKN